MKERCGRKCEKETTYTQHTHKKIKFQKHIYFQIFEICPQCVPAGTLPLMSPTTPQNRFFQAPQEFEDPSQMVEWLIMLDFKLQPERMVVGDFLHVRRALHDIQVCVCVCGCHVDNSCACISCSNCYTICSCPKP